MFALFRVGCLSDELLVQVANLVGLSETVDMLKITDLREFVAVPVEVIELAISG